jgi:hypothetical protein
VPSYAPLQQTIQAHANDGGVVKAREQKALGIYGVEFTQCQRTAQA